MLPSCTAHELRKVFNVSVWHSITNITLANFEEKIGTMKYECLRYERQAIFLATSSTKK